MALLIERPSKVIAVGLNYRSHCEEAGAAVPPTPMVFAHWPNALIGPGDAIVLPPPAIEDFVDFEAELGVVIGQRCKGVDVAQALNVVEGYCCFNDVSARRLQMSDSGGQHTLGKSVDTFDAVGPLTPASHVPDPQRLRIRAIVNGVTRQDANTSDMIFSVAEVIAYVSRTVTLEAGDLLAMGTPAGVGFLAEPPTPLAPGDVVTIDIEGLEPLTNPVHAA